VVGVVILKTLPCSETHIYKKSPCSTQQAPEFPIVYPNPSNDGSASPDLGCGGSVAGLVRAGQLSRHALHLGSQEGLAYEAQVRRRTRLRLHRHLQPRILVRLFPIDFTVSDSIFKSFQIWGFCVCACFLCIDPKYMFACVVRLVL
jgi:hypothetical protein